MKRARSHHPGTFHGFTLVEILIVAALISLFAAIAMFNIQYFAIQAKRKAATADARSISDAMTAAHFEYGFYTKLCYLCLSRSEIERLVDQQMQIVPDFDYIGFDSVDNRVLLPRSRRILDSWRGPYLPSPAGRQVGSNSGVVKMRMPYQPQGTPVSELYDWPADPWGNPYVVYLVGETADGRPTWITSPTDRPVYFARVVSYGPNGIPGGFPDIEQGLPSGSGSDLRRYVEEHYVLYKKEDNHFVALTPQEYEVPVNRLSALKKELGYLSADPRFADKVPGIMDPGSDDLTVALH